MDRSTRCRSSSSRPPPEELHRAGELSVELAGALQAESGRHEAWRGALARVIARVRAGGDLHESLTELAGAARALAGADLALVIGPRPGRRRPGVLTAEGAPRLVGLPARRQPLSSRLVADVSRNPPVSRMPRMGSAIVVPVTAPTGTIDSLWLMNGPRRPAFDEAMLGLVRSLGELTSLVMGASRAPHGNRERVTLDLHDDVVQTLFGIGMEVQAAALRVGDPELAARLRAAARNVDRVMERLRAHDRESGRAFSS
jgi:hypothetical protein